MKKIWCTIVLIFILLPQFVAASNLAIIETDLEIEITPGINESSGNITIDTEDWTREFSCGEGIDKIYPITFGREVEGIQEKRYKNMTKICNSIGNQYDEMLKNMNYIDNYTSCNSRVRSAIDTKEIFESDLKDCESNLTKMTEERDTYFQKYSSCNTEKNAMMTEKECKDEYDNNNGYIIGALIGFGAAYYLYVMRPEKKRKEEMREQEEEIDFEEL